MRFVLLLGVVGCTGEDILFGPYGKSTFDDLSQQELGIAIVFPVVSTQVDAASLVNLQWADIASVPGTSVRLQAQRVAQAGSTTSGYSFTGPVIHLIGDGTPGSGRDALADGANDIYTWDTTGVRVGLYLITATIESPDGESAVALSNDLSRNKNGLINLTTTLPNPALTFNAPGATDVSVTTGNTFDITWTDNGNANADARLTLGLDTDDDHDNGNEIILLRDDLLSNDGNTGMFTFSFIDENGTTVPDGTYTVFAIVDDGAHDPVEVEATGLLMLNP